ncbi:GNAT family N-acetyltransferase, partial [Nostoc sp. CHAB 5834]|nr:GNAT family N-acetyltransferase [Nostoc sp. CHAB 5834]
NTGLEEARVVLAFEENKPVGCACYKVLELATTIEIKRMYVQPAYRRLRVAQQLLAQLEAWAKEENYQMAVLQTATKQPESIALYQRCGYESMPCYGVYVGDVDSVCMRKPLH